MESGEENDWFVDSTDLSPVDHLETQAIVQRQTDGAVSKTINMPKGTTPDQLSRLMLEYIRDLKGVTVYVDGSRKGQILNSVPIEDVKKYIKEGHQVKDGADPETVECASGQCEI